MNDCSFSVVSFSAFNLGLCNLVLLDYCLVYYLNLTHMVLDNKSKKTINLILQFMKRETNTGAPIPLSKVGRIF